MIVSYRNRETRMLSEGIRVKEFQPFERIAMRKLLQLQAALTIGDLRVPPGNRLEALHGNREGQYSIRVNNRYRICFVWTAAGPSDVEIVDYH